MDNLALALTHSSSYLSKFKSDIEKFYDLSKDTYEDILDFDKDDEHYNDKIRKTIKDYTEEYEKIFDFEEDELKLFLNDLTIVSRNRADDSVIYSLKKYLINEKEISKFYKKKFIKFIDELEDEHKDKFRENEYVLSIGIKSIYVSLNKLKNYIEQVLTHLKSITKWNEEEDD